MHECCREQRSTHWSFSQTPSCCLRTARCSNQSEDRIRVFHCWVSSWWWEVQDVSECCIFCSLIQPLINYYEDFWVPDNYCRFISSLPWWQWWGIYFWAKPQGNFFFFKASHQLYAFTISLDVSSRFRNTTFCIYLNQEMHFWEANVHCARSAEMFIHDQKNIEKNAFFGHLLWLTISLCT